MPPQTPPQGTPPHMGDDPSGKDEPKPEPEPQPTPTTPDPQQQQQERAWEEAERDRLAAEETEHERAWEDFERRQDQPPQEPTGGESWLIREHFPTLEQAVGRPGEELTVVGGGTTTNARIHAQGYTQTYYVYDMDNNQTTVFYNRTTETWAATHWSSANR